MSETKKLNLELLEPNARYNLLVLLQPGQARIEDILPKFEILAEIMTRDLRPPTLVERDLSGTDARPN